MKRYLESVLVSKIKDSPNRGFEGSEDSFECLKESIKEHGIINPPLVRRLDYQGNFVIVAGRRRLRAARELGMKSVDCVVLESGKVDADDAMALAENVDREDMNVVDEAELFRKLKNVGGKSVKELAALYARSENAIRQRLKIAALIKPLKEWVAAGKMAVDAGVVIGSLLQEAQEKFAAHYKDYVDNDRRIDGNDAANFVEKSSSNYLYLLEDRSPCDKCKWALNFSGQGILFEDIVCPEDVCTDSDCFDDMLMEQIRRRIQRLLKRKIDTVPVAGIQIAPVLLEAMSGKVTFSADLPLVKEYPPGERLPRGIKPEDTSFDTRAYLCIEHSKESDFIRYWQPHAGGVKSSESAEPADKYKYKEHLGIAEILAADEAEASGDLAAIPLTPQEAAKLRDLVYDKVLDMVIADEQTLPRLRRKVIKIAAGHGLLDEPTVKKLLDKVLNRADEVTKSLVLTLLYFFYMGVYTVKEPGEMGAGEDVKELFGITMAQYVQIWKDAYRELFPDRFDGAGDAEPEAGSAEK